MNTVSTFAWLVRRECWENRAIWMIPVVMSGALTLAALFGHGEIDLSVSAAQSHWLSGTVLYSVGILFFLVMSLYSNWYLLDSLYADRKDRSIQFWKSLPVSDTVTVLAKLFTGLLVIPLLYFVAADLTTLLVAFVVTLRSHSAFGPMLWRADDWLQLQVLWLYVIVTTAVWYLPFTGWCLVASAWVRRAVMLWAFLVPFALFLVERWFLGTHVFGTLVVDRFRGYFPHAFNHPFDHVGPTPSSIWRLIDPAGFLTATSTWLGVLVGAGFIAIAIQLRWRRTEQ